MLRHDLTTTAVRRRRPGLRLAPVAALALSGSVLALGVPALAATPAAAASAPQAVTGELVVPAKPPTRAADDHILSAGQHGWIAQRESGDRYYTDAATGARTLVPARYTTLNDAVAGTVNKGGGDVPGSVDLFDPASGATRTVIVPEGQYPVVGGFTDRHILTQEREGSHALHILDLDDEGGYTDRLLTDQLPEGYFAQVRSVRGDKAYLYSLKDGKTRDYAVLSWSKGTLTSVFAPGQAAYTGISLSQRWVSAYYTGADFTLVADLQHPEEPARKISLPAPTAGTTRYTGMPAVVGDWLVLAHKDSTGLGAGQNLVATSLTGKGTVTLAVHANPVYAATPDGGLLVASGDTVADWAVRRISTDATGALTARVERALPQESVPYRGIALAGGRLSLVADHPNTNLPQLLQQDLTTSGTLAATGAQTSWTLGLTSEKNACGTGCYALFGTGAGGTALDLAGRVVLPTSSSSQHVLSAKKPLVLEAVFGRWSLMREQGGSRYDIGDTESNTVVHSFDAPVAGLWGNTVWKPSGTKGSVVAYDLKTKKTSAAVSLGSGTTPTQLQAVGRWLYWSAGSKAGVYDRTTKKNITVPAGGKVLLADGYLLRQDGTRLDLIDFHSGGGHSTTTSTIAQVPASSRPRVEWTVDPLGDGLAYTDAEHNVHVRRVTIPPSPIANAESRTTGAYLSLSGKNKWTGTWQLTRPASAWRLDIRDVWGHTVATTSGTARTGAEITAAWDGLVKGKKAVNGKYTFALSAKGVGDSAYRSLATGNIEVASGSAAFHSAYQRNDGQVFTLNTKGQFTAHDFHGGHTKKTASGWPTTSTLVPFGDALGNGGNDLIVRDKAGKVYRYEGTGNGPVTPKAAKILVGTGWNIYDTLTSVGDLNRDGRPDLVARRSDNGDLWAYYGTAAGTFTKKRIGINWKQYSHIVGAGDLNGDGHGDLLARGKDGTLYRYDGKGNGAFAARVKVFSKWGSSYKDIVVAGDITGDGRSDLVVRDSAGKLWYNVGNGKGSFSARKSLDKGWSGYKQVR
ncbi:FG-GAP-like repeat-containing protein [Streptomyces sp. NPDC001255]|uniref:FG-GAP-like repeat-containing protein n=1 Tax=Streptomyces sp. NPDC001255 TaxID=3364550 RepID=UPI0036AEF33B